MTKQSNANVFKQANKSNSICSAASKVCELLTKREKFTWLMIVCFALLSSCLELITAAIIVYFAQILNDPSSGLVYLEKIGFSSTISSGRIVFYSAIIIGVVYTIKNIVAALEIFFQNLSIQKMNYNFKKKLLNKYATTDYGYYLTRNSALGLNVVNNDVEYMFTDGLVPFASLISETVIFVCLISFIIYMNPSLACSIFGIGLVLGLFLTKIVLPNFYKWGKDYQEASIHGNKNLMQFFHAFKEIILLGKKDSFVAAYHQNAKDQARAQALQTSTNALPRIVLELIFIAIFVFVISYLCLDHESPVQMLGILGGYLYTGFRLMPGLNRIIVYINTVKVNMASIEKIYDEYNNLNMLENYSETETEIKENHKKIPGFNFNNNISLSNISFKYLKTNKNVLNNISLEIKKGENIGIIGETGSGKSTIIDIILGLLKPYSGTVLIDNKYPINSSTLYSIAWHKKIGYVPQSIYLVDDTIEANIAFGEDPMTIDQDQILNVIKWAQLSEFIGKLPQGVKTIVGERGVRLSGGERQRIAIARALYHNPSVLIFDEATSALDHDTEVKLIETINQLSKDRTLIMVAHRVTTLKGCAKIFVIENGVIKKVTNYYDLVENRGEKEKIRNIKNQDKIIKESLA